MPAREAYLVKKNNSLVVSPLRADTVSSSSETSLFQINLLVRVSSRPRGERPYPGQGGRQGGGNGDRETVTLEKEWYTLSPPQLGFRSRVLVPQWPKRRNTLGSVQWVSRPGHEDLVSFSCELLTWQTVGGVWKSTLPRKQVPWSRNDTQPCLPPPLPNLLLFPCKPALPTTVNWTVSPQNSHLPGTSEWDLFGNRVFRDLIEVRIQRRSY